MLQPACKGLDEVLDNGIRPGCGAHAKLHSNGGIGARLGTMVQVRVALDQIAMTGPRPPVHLARKRERSARPGDAKHRPARVVRVLSSRGLSLCGDTLSPALSRKRERERTFCAANRTARPPTHTGC